MVFGVPAATVAAGSAAHTPTAIHATGTESSPTSACTGQDSPSQRAMPGSAAAVIRVWMVPSSVVACCVRLGMESGVRCLLG